MKGSLKLRPRRTLNRAEAWACLTANLALPGSGSLAAGYAIGYAQMAAAFIAEVLTCVTGIPMIKWVLSGASSSESSLGDLWYYAHWPVACIGLFAAAVLWALTTSLTILARAPKAGVPPKIP
jgi:hypothetical protein